MSLFRAMRKTISSNSYLIYGVIIGVIISQSLNNYDCDKSINFLEESSFVNDENAVLPHVHVQVPNNAKIPVNANKKVVEEKKTEKRISRPRYYSTELGIREKLFVGILTAEERLNTQCVYLNRTIGHCLDQIKFFISVHNKPKAEYSLTNIVGFTDTRLKYKPFQVIKYLSDNFIQQYDFFFIMNDYNFLDARRLKDVVNKISISQDVYLGTTAKDSSFCDLNAGILLSNSVVTLIKNNMDWCVKYAISEDHSENLGRCIHYSTGLECQERVQDQSLNSHKLKHFGLKKHFDELSRLEEFNNALSIYPVLQEHEFYLLNAYFSRLRLEEINEKIEKLSFDLTNSWPPGEKPPVKPATRFDLPRQIYFNTTHAFFPDDFTNIQPHKTPEFQDIQKLISTVVEKVYSDNPNSFMFRRLINGYRTFDWSRGLDYVVDLGFRDLITGKEVTKRFEICKPLGKVEFISAPYVTESTRVIMLVPVQETEVEMALSFVNNFEKTFMQNKHKVLLVLAFLYRYDDPSKGAEDSFKQLKDDANRLTNEYRNEDSKILWVSIRMPKTNEKSDKRIDLNENKLMQFAVIDLALKKIGADNLVLVLDVYAEPGVTFINRVRMNTIVNFQIFNPIPFRQYDPIVSKVNTADITKDSGHFDREEYKYVSFYGRDYVNMRRKSQGEIPIIKADNDIEKLFQVPKGTEPTVFGMFVKYCKGLHAMRATDMALMIKYHLEKGPRENLFIGSKTQLAKMILSNEDKVGLKL